jgi:hypothetical protein
MNEFPRQKLCEIIKRYGTSVCDDPLRFEGLIRDFCGDYRKETSALIGAVREGIPSDLLKSQKNGLTNIFLIQSATKLENNLGLSDQAAKWAVESWAIALGVISSNDIAYSVEQVTDSQTDKLSVTSPKNTQFTTKPLFQTTPIVIQPTQKNNKKFILPMIAGIAIGTTLMGILYSYNRANEQAVNVQPQAAASTYPTVNPSPTMTSTSSDTSGKTAEDSSVSSITEDQAIDLIKRWLDAKSKLLTPPYDTVPTEEVLTGKAYECNVKRQNGEESSVDWMRNNGSSWEFSLQHVDKVISFTPSQDHATMTVAITEKGVLRNKNGDIDSDNSYFNQRTLTYDFQLVDRQWKISYYKMSGCD